MKGAFKAVGLFLGAGLLINGWSWLKCQPWAPEWIRRQRKVG